MKASVKWMQWYAQDSAALQAPIGELAQKIGAQLGAIEKTENLGEKYKGIIIANVVSVKDHENSDHLHIVMIDDGGVAQNVPRDDNGHVQVVCGANNLYEGMLVPWLPPGAVVPETIGKEPFVLEAREMRGVMSNGMLASARELALGTDHTGIVDLTPDRHPREGGNPAEKGSAEGAASSTGSPVAAGDDKSPKPGDDFAAVYELDDYIIDIENKMFTHRPDLFGQLGVAREIVGIQQETFLSPEWYSMDASLPKPDGETLPFEIRNELPELVPRFTAIVMRDVTVKPSPLWLQTYLLRVGVRPISNVVDLTNYYMLLTGQPLHAYDYDKVKALSGDKPVLVARYPHQGEKLTLLNGKTIEPRAEAIMIATDKQPIGLGGVMGGGETEVSDETKNVIIECATFDMYSIRRTSMAHGLFTDAVTRFNKGQSPLQNLAVLAKIVEDMSSYAGGKIARELIDDNHVAGRQWVHPPVPVTTGYINDRLGLHLSAEDMKRLLENVEFKVELSEASSSRMRGSSEKDIAEGGGSSDWIPSQAGNDDTVLTITAPFWRTDIELREDIVEEIGRLYGYDHLPLDLPLRTVAPAPKDELLTLKSAIREKLVKSGANEVLTYSFVHGNLLEKAGQNKLEAFQISNAISPDLQYYRLSLTPSLLDRVHPNVKAGYDAFALFELGFVHHKGFMDEADANVPLEDLHVSLVFAATDKAMQKDAGADYYEARKYLETVLPEVVPMLVPLKEFDFKGDVPGMQMCAPYEPNRSAVIVWNDLAWGVVGEFKQSVIKALKLPAHAAGFELGLEVIRNAPAKKYQALPRFPKVEQDICLKVPAVTTYRQVQEFAAQKIDALKPAQTTFALRPIDIYQREDDREHKQITLRLSIASYEKTMTDSEVAKLLDDVAAAARDVLHAERI